MKQSRKNNQIINSGKGCAVLPLVDGLRRIEAKDHLKIVYGQAGGLPQIDNVGTGLCQINGWNIHPKHLLF